MHGCVQCGESRVPTQGAVCGAVGGVCVLLLLLLTAGRSPSKQTSTMMLDVLTRERTAARTLLAEPSSNSAVATISTPARSAPMLSPSRKPMAYLEEAWRRRAHTHTCTDAGCVPTRIEVRRGHDTSSAQRGHCVSSGRERVERALGTHESRMVRSATWRQPKARSIIGITPAASASLGYVREKNG